MKTKYPNWLRTAVFYQIYPQSFYDSNGDGIGDINGIIQKLDYIEYLGCNALWINPCFKSPFNDAGYDVSDFYTVAERYGTNSDLKRLFKEARKRGIRVCLDLVAGHTSFEHPWFLESAKAGKNKYSNWYIWTDSVWQSVGNNLDAVRGFSQRRGNYVANFFWSQPALNYGFARPDPTKQWQLSTDHPDVKAVRKEIMNIMRYWLDMGASGFRVDMASALVKGDKDWKSNSRLWREVRAMFDRDYPQAVLISEWSYPTAAINAGFHVDFMININDTTYNHLFRMEKEHDILGIFDSGHSFFSKEGKGDITVFLESLLAHTANVKNKGLISIPSGNHDMSRISLGRTNKELELIFAFLLTMSGVPFIYYGDEIGMKYIKSPASKEGGYGRTGSRTPMQWSSGKNAGFSDAAAAKLYLPIDSSRYCPNVEKQKKKLGSLLNKIREFIAMRKQLSALSADADFIVLYAKPKKYPFIYMRMKGKEKILLVFNPSGKEVRTRLHFSAVKGSQRPEMGSGAIVSTGSGLNCIYMPPISYGIFKLG